MYSQKWNIGIDLYQNKIQLVAIKKYRKYWSLCECWQHHFPIDFIETPEHEQRVSLLDILIQWRQKLPKNCTASITLPSHRTLKQQLTLPTQMHLQQPELSWYIQTRIEKLFPMQVEELALDYRIIGSHVYLNGARKSDIMYWQTLLKESGFNLLAIDIAPITLRYIARHAGLPDECWVVHHRQGEWLWSGPMSQPANYNHIQDNEILTLPQLAPFFNTEEESSLPVYYIGDQQIGDHQGIDAHHQWELLQAFRHHTLKLPHQLGDFVIAAGLALRHRDK